MPSDPQPAGLSNAIPRERQFVHLHLHTEYSLLDGGNRVDRLVKRVAELGMTAVGVTDHGNLFGAVAFYQACKDRGIKPILGVEAYVTPPGKPRTDRTYSGGGEGGYHLVLLAESNDGWANLLTLCSEAYLTGFYYKPRIDRELLTKHASGLIAINGHLGSEIGDHLLDYERSADEKYWRAAVESARWHASVFAPTGAGPRFYVELQHHVPEQNAINKHLLRLAKEVGAPLVCDNDAHFLRAEDHDAHDSLICISTGKLKSDQNRMRYPPEIYVKSPQEMRELFEPYGAEGKEALDNTVAIAERCNVELALGKSNAPMVRVIVPDTGALPRLDDPEFGGDSSKWYTAYCAKFEVLPFKQEPSADELAKAKADCDRALHLLAEAGFRWRYGDGGFNDSEKRARLERELKILADKNISAYFLIVWDFVNWGRQRAIPANARGSGVGTMVGYVLGLSNACPVKYGLLFERFTDPDRSEYPDIDIDLCQDGRAAVIDYVRRKYGHVAQIITFGTMKAKAALRDVGRVMGVPLSDVDRIAKLVPEQLNITIESALEQEPDLKRLYDSDDQVRRLIDTSRALEGHTRHAGVHAAGVIVATRPLHEVVPLYKPPGGSDDEIITQWDGPTCEKMGLLKMDFLGLRTLSVIERARALIRQGLGEREIWRAVGREAEFDGSAGAGPHPLDLDRLDYGDQNVFEVFRRGDTTGVFQFESPGMRRLLVDMRPDRLEDLIAANALFRPGPMDLIPDYNRRKHGQAPVPRVHDVVDRFTAETYGVMVYQEQVMQIVHGLGGIKLRDAYTLIKNISKKKHDKIEKERPKFIEGACRQGLSKAQAEELFELILKFAGYGFNKSHSTGYAIVAYQTAYLKTYFPAQYMAAFLTYEASANKVSDWIPYVEDARKTRTIDARSGRVIRSGIEVRPPDVNRSQAAFSVVFEAGEERDAAHGHIRFGLAAIKGVGDKAIEAIIAERDGAAAAAVREPAPFTSLFDFCERVLSRGAGVINKAAIEALVKCGAFDGVHGMAARASMVATIEQAVSAGQKAAADKASGQGALFGFGGSATAAPAGPRQAKSGAVTLARATAWTQGEALAHEKEVLGFFVSSHPLEAWKHWYSTFVNATCASVKAMGDQHGELGAGPARSPGGAGVPAGRDARVVVAGLIQSVRYTVVKNGKSAGQKMAMITLEDQTGTIGCVIFSDAFAKYGHLIAPDKVVFMLGRVDTSRADVQILGEKIVPIECVPLQPGRVRVTVDEIRLNGGAGHAIAQVGDILKTHSIAPGPMKGIDVQTPFPIELAIATADHIAVMATPPTVRIALEPALITELEGVLGEGSVRLLGGVAVEVSQNGNGHRKWERRRGDDD